MKSVFVTLSVFLLLAMPISIQGGQLFSHHAPRGNDPAHHLHPQNQAPPPSQSNNQPPAHGHAPPVPHLEWNSQIGQQSRQGGDRAQQFEPYANFALQLQEQQQQQQQPSAQNMPMMAAANAPRAAVACPTRDRVYLPDMQSFLIKTPLTYSEAVQACIACGSELVLVDGTNIDRFQEAFSSLGLYGDQTFWIKSWFGESTRSANECPAARINSLMGNRLERKLRTLLCCRMPRLKWAHF
ncbi:unnamed protein product [Mortierella alpina]